MVESSLTSTSSYWIILCCFDILNYVIHHVSKHQHLLCLRMKTNTYRMSF